MPHFIETCSARAKAKNSKIGIVSRQPKKHLCNPLSVLKKKLPVSDYNDTLSSISVNWSSIQDYRPRARLSTIRGIVGLAVEANKKTLTIENIAKYNPYDVNSAAKVLSSKKEVVDAVGKSAKRLLNTPLINRLFLDGDRFGVRFYLSEEHPTDYINMPCER